MCWIIGGAGIALGCYILGYVIGSVITNERRNQAREEMGLETDEGCYGCKDVGLPCDPKCKFNAHDGLDFAEIGINSITDYEEVKEDEQSEKNISESDEA